MSVAAILGAITALGTIVGGLVYVFKYSAWAFTKTPQEKEEKILKEEQEKEDAVKSSGRPQ